MPFCLNFHWTFHCRDGIVHGIIETALSRRHYRDGIVHGIVETALSWQHCRDGIVYGIVETALSWQHCRDGIVHGNVNLRSLSKKHMKWVESQNQFIITNYDYDKLIWWPHLASIAALRLRHKKPQKEVKIFHFHQKNQIKLIRLDWLNLSERYHLIHILNNI